MQSLLFSRKQPLQADSDAKSLIINSVSTTHQQLTADEQVASGVTADFIRLSVGIVGLDYTIADIEQALTSSQR